MADFIRQAFVEEAEDDGHRLLVGCGIQFMIGANREMRTCFVHTVDELRQCLRFRRGNLRQFNEPSSDIAHLHIIDWGRWEQAARR